MAVLLFFVAPVCVIGLLLVVKIVSWFYDLITETTYTPCGIPYQKRTPTSVIPTAQEVKPFSPSDYLERIESEHIKILQDKEERGSYTIILWLNLNGLRLNEDGSFEWVQRVKKKELDKVEPQNIESNEILALMRMNQCHPTATLYFVDQMIQSYQSQRENLMNQCFQSQLQSIHMAQMQQAQNMAMINSIYSPYRFEGLNYGQTTQHF